MIFKVTTSDIFYTIPSSEELREAEEIVANLCRERIITAYNGKAAIEKQMFDRFDAELEKMRATKTAFTFLILREIAILSRSEGYPIIALGNLSGSVISYLLGITELDPFEFYTPEIVWGTDTKPLALDFTIGIASQVRPLLPKRLDVHYGFVSCDKELFRQISLVDVKSCEQLGTLAQTTGKNPSVCDFDSTTYFRAAKAIIDEFSKVTGFLAPLSKETTNLENWDFNLLLRLYAFTTAEFSNENFTLNLTNQNIFVTREEFFNNLVHHNVPNDIALDIVKKGVGAVGDKREKYVELLESYHVPESIKNYFTKVTHLWTAASCVGRALHKCYIAWYQENYPEIFDKLNN